MCAIGPASLIMCYLWWYKWLKINCFSTFEVKLVSMRLCVSEANDGWWHSDQYYSLEQTSRAEGAIWPQCCLSALWYTLRERGCGDSRGGRIWWVHAAQTTNGRWACVCAQETVHREQQRKRVAFEGLTFICGTMSHFLASHRQFFVCAWGFLAHVSLKCKWNFLLFCPIKRGIKIG